MKDRKDKADRSPLTKVQMILRREGLLARPDEWYRHESGTFTMAPYDSTGRRARTYLVVDRSSNG